MSMATDGNSRVRRLARRLGFGRNPLRRRVDRIESAMLVAAALIAVLVIPAAVAVGTAVRDASEQAAAHRRSLLTQTTARTLADAETWAGAIPGQGLTSARVAWTDAAGASHEGWTLVTMGTKKGSDVTIWLDRSGSIVRPPGQADESGAIGGVAGLTTAMISWMVLSCLTRLVLRGLDRRRARDLDREWEQVAPRWRHHES
jgi:hypothetical protein